MITTTAVRQSSGRATPSRSRNVSMEKDSTGDHRELEEVVEAHTPARKGANGPLAAVAKVLKMKKLPDEQLTITERHQKQLRQEARARRIARDPRSKIMALLDDPTSSKPAYFTALLVFLVIVVSCAAFVIETLPEFYDKDKEVWFGIEGACVAIFTVEFGMRLVGSTVTCKVFWKMWRDPLTYVDVIAIVPFYVELIFDAASNLAIVRIIRLARVFRVFKLSRYSSGLQTVGVALSKSRDALMLLAFFMTIALILFSSAMYYAERGTYDETKEQWLRDDGTESPFRSIPHSFWWCITTLTTVGYGDNVPVTTYGKILASLTMIAGVLIIALPASIIGSNFMDQYRKSKEAEEYKKRQEFRLKRLNMAAEDVGLREQVQFLQRDNDELLSLFSEIQGLIKESVEKQKDLRIQLEVLNRRLDQKEELERAVLSSSAEVEMLESNLGNKEKGHFKLAWLGGKRGSQEVHGKGATQIVQDSTTTTPNSSAEDMEHM